MKKTTNKKKTNENAKEYSSNESYYIGDLICHLEYGLGTVTSSFGNKIEVLFNKKLVVLSHKVMF